MKKSYSIPALAIIVSCMSLASCSKKESSKSNTEKISASAWKYDKAELDANGDGTGDTPIPGGLLEACETDNLITFKADGSGTVDEGPTKCNSSDPQTVAFSWTFKTNETIINFPTAILPGLDGDVKLIALTETSMVVSKSLPASGTVPIPVTIVLTLKH